LTAEQLEASRAERMRHNGHRALTLEDARTWIEETGLCLFLPKRQFSSSIAPSFVEAVAGHQNATPDPKHIQLAEELLVRLELDDVAVRLNLLGQPGEQPDFVVASWVLPYVYALRGDRDWRRSPQLTGSRQVSQLAVQAYKLLEAADNNIAGLTHTLGREVTETAVIRAITELWQQLRIIPVIAAPGVPAKWQLLRHRFQKAIAEGASTSQVTAISVLASIYLQAVIAASMEEVELFLAPLTARSKVREVLRGLVATRQVHTISMGPAPHFYVAGTLPEFSVAPTLYSSSSMPASAYFLRSHHEDELAEIEAPRQPAFIPAPAPVESHQPVETETHTPRIPAVDKPAASAAKPAAARPHFSRPAAHSRDRKPTQLSAGNRPVRRPAADTRSASARPAPRPAGARPGSGPRRTEGVRAGTGTRWSPAAPSNSKAKHNGAHPGNGHPANGGAKAVHSNGKGGHPANASNARTAKSSTPAWGQHNGHAANGHSSKAVKPAGKSNGRSSNLVRTAGGPRSASSPRKDTRPDARSSSRNGGSRKPALAAGTKAGNSKRYGFTARPAVSSPAKETKKRG
jgi:23S rRNA pseudouridine2605 synthase